MRMSLIEKHIKILRSSQHLSIKGKSNKLKNIKVIFIIKPKITFIKILMKLILIKQLRSLFMIMYVYLFLLFQQ
jgi:hypothetical protein